MPVKQITIDPKAGAVYLKLNEGKVSRTKEFSEEVFLDFDSKGKLMGIELLNPCQGTIHEIAEKYHLSIVDNIANPIRKILRAV
ncbi:MAG: hypothetical protein A2787_01865 [Omnitrophica WOR_2 bacterium RIFCSPHIGHO2_01_FULL_48_9]|nr:MAG: hypothetical protein A2787_01865 [Omnitrophica WOR_2 bacterium RIFCSPHIGHO2_01_FULL_48_9]